MCLLTGYSVDGFERSKYTHCSDGGEVDVLEIKGVFNYPEKNKQTEKISVTVTGYRQTLSVVSVVQTSSLKQSLDRDQKRVEFESRQSPHVLQSIRPTPLKCSL